MRPYDVRKEVTAVALLLQESDLAISSSIHKIVSLGRNESRVTWSSHGDGLSFYDFTEGGFEQYRHALRNQQFSVVLNDGSLLQISYDFRRNELVRHRLAFLPSPINILRQDIEDTTIDDFLELCSFQEIYDRVRTRPYLRFDFDAEGPESEPFCHAHTCFPGSRIPVCGPISVSQFIGFIFENFYAAIYASTDWLRGAQIEMLPHQMRDEHRGRLHFNVQRAAVHAI